MKSSPLIAQAATVMTAGDSELGFRQSLLAQRLSDYLQLCRPRIAVISAAAAAVGFVLASAGEIQWDRLTAAVGGIVCFVAASSILNQVLEHRIDRRMKRTADRPLAAQRLSLREARILGAAAVLLGCIVLSAGVNPVVCVSALATCLIYVLAYTPLKRCTSLCTTVGAIPGAMPPVLGWLAGGGGVGVELVSLFALFFTWQFPHFLAIGWIYRDDYERAGLKMLPSYRDSGYRAGVVALIYAIAFVPVSLLPRYAGLAGNGYALAAIVLSCGYLFLTLRFFVHRTDGRARQLMLGSLICLPALLLSLLIDFLRLTSGLELASF